MAARAAAIKTGAGGGRRAGDREKRGGREPAGELTQRGQVTRTYPRTLPSAVYKAS